MEFDIVVFQQDSILLWNILANSTGSMDALLPMSSIKYQQDIAHCWYNSHTTERAREDQQLQTFRQQWCYSSAAACSGELEQKYNLRMCPWSGLISKSFVWVPGSFLFVPLQKMFCTMVLPAFYKGWNCKKRPKTSSLSKIMYDNNCIINSIK